MPTVSKTQEIILPVSKIIVNHYRMSVQKDQSILLQAYNFILSYPLDGTTPDGLLEVYSTYQDISTSNIPKGSGTGTSAQACP